MFHFEGLFTSACPTTITLGPFHMIISPVPVLDVASYDAHCNVFLNLASLLFTSHREFTFLLLRPLIDSWFLCNPPCPSMHLVFLLWMQHSNAVVIKCVCHHFSMTLFRKQGMPGDLTRRNILYCQYVYLPLKLQISGSCTFLGIIAFPMSLHLNIVLDALSVTLIRSQCYVDTIGMTDHMKCTISQLHPLAIQAPI